MNESITSVAKQPQRLADAASAITVLTHDDLRRSGATSVMEALRGVPGLHVAAVDSRQWAISARGFNGLYANKLLVLIDGRAVYTPIFAGVFWDLQQVPLEDVERIEVIRGPGATLWGANAVNGVINVITRSARDTQGEWAEAGGGDVHRATAGARDGGRLDEHAWYRVFGGYHREADFPTAAGADNDDSWQSGHAGLRIDADPQPETHWTWQADATKVASDSDRNQSTAANGLGRWTRRLGQHSNVEVQAYGDFVKRDDQVTVNSRTTTLDLEAQHAFAVGRNAMIWGLGYRRSHSSFEQTNPTVIVADTDSPRDRYGVFVQDDFRLVPDKVSVTGGIKFEHNDFTGWEVQPSLRAAYTPEPLQTFWAALSRAVRSPSDIEAGSSFAYVAGPPLQGPGGAFYLPVIFGNPQVRSEVLRAAEFGYRAALAHWANLDIASYYHDYSRLIGAGSVERFDSGSPVGTAVLTWGNGAEGETFGGELALAVVPAEAWRLAASYSLLRANFSSTELSVTQTPDKSTPRRMAGGRVSWDFAAAASLDARARHVGGFQSVPAYTTVDLRLSWRPAHGLEFTLVGQNLLDAQHPEQENQTLAAAGEVPRGFYARAGWRF